jgi:hypothetical protein
MTTEIGWEKQLIDDIADTLVSVHPICNHPFLNETTRPVRRTQAPFPCVFLRLRSSYSSAVPRHFIYGAVTTRQSGLHEATHLPFDGNENEWPSREAVAPFSLLHEQEAKPCNPHNLVFEPSGPVNVDCSRVLDLANGPQTSSRRYDVSNDHTLTALDPLVV